MSVKRELSLSKVRFCEVVSGIVHQRVEGVAERSLPKEFKGSAAHPLEDVDLFGAACADICDKAIAELREESRPPHQAPSCANRQLGETLIHLVSRLVEDGGYATKIGDREDRGEHLALLPVLRSLRREQTRSEKPRAGHDIDVSMG